MLDIKLLRENPDIITNSLMDRQAPKETLELIEKISEKDRQWRKIKFEEEELRGERNRLSRAINEKKKAKKKADTEIKRSGEVAKRIKEISQETEMLEKGILEQMLGIPNIPDKSVPKGKDESENKELRKWGKPGKKPKDILSHYEMSKQCDWIDHERGVKLACHRFSVLKGPFAKLEGALIPFMLNVQTQKGYPEISPPYLVNTKTITGTGQLPKFADDQYKIEDEDLWLIPTAEVPLTNLYAGEVLDEKDLPRKVTAYTPCFRREAGAYGRDIHGLIRQHQFDKVELVKFAHPERSFKELESLTKDAERILELLEIPYRTIELCTGDIGFSAAKTYDVEVWIPSQNTYREISSCSNCTDFQARRANIRYLSKDGKMEFVHTLNGSGLAVGRCLIAVLENYQEDKKKIRIPKVLRDYMGEDEIKFSP